MIRIAPSILSANFCTLGKDVQSIADAGADWVHFDVMDGVFVPNISVGLPVLESLRKGTDMFIDVHLMIKEPVKYVERFCRAGADLVTVHYEADTEENISAALSEIRKCGKLSGISVKPGTPAEVLEKFIDMTDLILVMTVEPGFGGQKFMPSMLEKIGKCREMIGNAGRQCFLEVDGGIDDSTSALVKDKGADVLVAGSYFFKAADRSQAVVALKESKIN